MRQIFPSLGGLLERLASRYRQGDPAGTIAPERLAEEPAVTAYLEDLARSLVADQLMPPAEAMESADFLGSHIFYMVNFEIHHRKTFWVEESLAWMFRQTRLDIEGECLRLPFPACAFIFSDPPMLKLSRHVLAQSEPVNPPPAPRILTVYLTELATREEALILNVSLLFDARDGDWPYLISRDLYIRSGDSLEEILESHCPEVAVDLRASLFTSAGLKDLLHVVLNCVLYATSAHLEQNVLQSPARRAQSDLERKGPKKRKKLSRQIDKLAKTYSLEDIFFLPGKIDISQYQRLSGLQKFREGRRIHSRFMVRGHWRKAATHWKDQRLRWIEPYWKGPDGAIPLDREYRLKP